MKNAIYIVILFLFFCFFTFSQNETATEDPVLDSIAKSIRSKENLTIEWETSFMYDKQRVNDVHTAKIKDKKFVHKTNSITITCNGELVCREYRSPEKKIVSNCDTTVDYNPIFALTFFGSGYKVAKIRRHRTSNKIKCIRITKLDSTLGFIKEAFLYFDELGTLSGIKFKTTGKFKNYVKIKKIDSSIVLKDSEFEVSK